jgi:DNA primase catalytic core
MARIPDTEIERLKSEISLERLAESQGIELKRHGADLIGLCPFHDDHEPSLVISPKKNLWHCLGACQSGGSVIDWVMKSNGISFRHAVELLREGIPALAAAPVKRSTVPKLPAPVSIDADDQAVLNQVIDYYHDTLKQSPEALAYLQGRGLDHPELIERFRLGYANRTLGLRLPEKNRVAGAELRSRLQRIGLYRDTGREHFNGSLVVPVLDAAGNVLEVYGRKLLDNLRAGTPKHLYLPGPHRGVWNVEALHASKEIILCEALIDAMTFWCAGYRNVTAAYGVEGFTEDHLAAFKQHGTERVLIAYDRDAAGDTAADKLAERLMSEGIECWRIQYPKGMDANEYAQKVTPAAKSLGLAIRKAVWLGQGKAPERTTQSNDAMPSVEVVANCDHLPDNVPPLAAKEEMSLPASPVPPAPALDIAATVTDSEIVLTFAERRYRVRGLAKNLSYEVMKVNVLASRGESFFVDTLDLYAARARAGYVTQAAIELRISEDILKTDLGRVLLKLEQLQDEQIKTTLTPAPVEAIAMNDADKTAALELLKAPNLLERILTDFEACGVTGETTNKLVGYLAATSRLLDHPLAVVIQSSSAAGKSSLMDAVLALMPEEERIKYSAMTGQSLFYMGETNLKHKCLAIVEEEGASRASYALKLLQSEGELTIASTGKDPNTGNLITQEYRVEGPVMIFLTTTAIEIDEELMNRCLVLSVDEGRAQTEAIHVLQRRKRTLAGLMAKTERECVIQLHRNAQRLLKPLAVVNPYADQLTFLSDKTRTRRDHEKYLTLIDTIALLHQHQRQIKTTQHRGQPLEYIEVTLDDIAAANRLAHEVLGRSLDELPPQTRRLLAAILDYVKTQTDAQQLRCADFRFSRKQLRAATGWGDTQLKLHLARLTELEYLLAHRIERGQGLVYELLYDGEGGMHPHLSGLIDAQSLGYDGARSGQNASQSAPGRGLVGGRSAPGRASESAQDPHAAGVSGELPDTDSKTHVLRGHAKTASYPQARAVPLAAAARD